jgi:hypothetical protein
LCSWYSQIQKVEGGGSFKVKQTGDIGFGLITRSTVPARRTVAHMILDGCLHNRSKIPLKYRGFVVRFRGLYLYPKAALDPRCAFFGHLANHNKDSPNCQLKTPYEVDGVYHAELITICKVNVGEWLTFDYGPNQAFDNQETQTVKRREEKVAQEKPTFTYTGFNMKCNNCGKQENLAGKSKAAHGSMAKKHTCDLSLL